MSPQKVPIVPQWNIQNVSVCTPDGGFLYIGSRSINYVGKVSNAETPPVMKVFHTRQTILSVDVDPGWPSDLAGNEPQRGSERYFVVLAQDNSIQIWDFDKGCALRGHKAHTNPARYMEGNGPSPTAGAAHADRVLLSYMSSRKVLSLDAQDILIYCVASNTYCRRPMFVSSRNQQFTVMRCAPHDENIFGLGTNRGLVIVGDLQKMCTIYTFRGHDAPITSLSWNNMAMPMAALAVVAKQKSPAKSEASAAIGGDEIFDIYDYDYLENEFGAPVKKSSESLNDFVGLERPQEVSIAAKFDFAEACQNLREDIDALKTQEESVSNETGESELAEQQEQQLAVTLADCQQVAKPANTSSSSSNDSTEGSLELIERSSSSDDVDVDGIERKNKQQILHQAEVHATQTLDRKNILAQEDGKPKAPETHVACITESKTDKPTVALVNKSVEKNEKSTVNSTGEFAILLASASNDGNLWIWNIENGASCDNLHPRTLSASGSNSKQRNLNIVITWLNATEFLATNKQGELSLWTLQQQPTNSPTNVRRYKFKQEKRQFKQRGVVAFSLTGKSGLLWTISSYREICCENIRDEQLIARYCCASTNISAMRECPDDMNKIALGFSDRRVGIIDISKMSATSVYIETFTLRIDSSVLSIVWSPDSKKLAYGTIEGRVGIVNTEYPKHQPYTFNPVSGKTIYSIDWQGPYIYVVSNEVLAVYDETSNNKDAQLISGIYSISAISVRDNFLFVGTQRGHLQVYRRTASTNLSYELLQDLECAPRYISEIAWSPIDKQQFAVVANANNINIFNFNAEKSVVVQTRKIVIPNPKAANACLKWSNHSPKEFLTCGFDGAVRVWDLNISNNEEKFIKRFHCPMTCGLFLPTDEQIVVCAGKSTSIEFFDMRLEKSIDNAPENWRRSTVHTLENVQWAQKLLARVDAKPSGAADKRRNRRVGAVDAASNNTTGCNDVENCETKEAVNEQNNELVSANRTTQIANMLNDLKIEENQLQQPQHSTQNNKLLQTSSVFMKSPATLLYLTTKELNKEALSKMSTILSVNPKSNNILCLKLFGKKSEAMELLAEELKNHQQSETKGIGSVFMPQLNANMKEEILKCIQNKQLCEWHISLAPTVSYCFWKKCCQAFAEQLMEQGYALQAATYMIAIHQQTEAIQMLLEQNYFKEALLVARVYLQDDDPLIAAIVDKWIAYLDSTGNLTAAAFLCTLSGQLNRAYEALAKIRNTQPEIERVLKLLNEHSK